MSAHLSDWLPVDWNDKSGLAREAVARDSLTTASDESRYGIELHNLDVAISVGYRVKSQRGVEFRRWTTDVLRRYITEAMLKTPDGSNSSGKSPA